MTIEYLSPWETLYNSDFKHTEFDRFREESGLNTFVLSPTKWRTITNTIGIISNSDRYGGGKASTLIDEIEPLSQKHETKEGLA